MKTCRKKVVVFMLLYHILAGCVSSPETPTMTPLPTVTPTLTATAIPTSTATVIPSPTPTPTASPTPTPHPAMSVEAREQLEAWRERLESGSWVMGEPELVENAFGDEEWQVRRSLPPTSRNDLVLRWDNELGEFVDYRHSIDLVDGDGNRRGEVRWGLSYEENPEPIVGITVEAEQIHYDWWEAIMLSVFNLANTDLNPGISLGQIKKGTVFQYLDSNGEVQEFNTKTVNFQWTTNSLDQSLNPVLTIEPANVSTYIAIDVDDEITTIYAFDPFGINSDFDSITEGKYFSNSLFNYLLPLGTPEVISGSKRPGIGVRSVVEQFYRRAGKGSMFDELIDLVFEPDLSSWDDIASPVKTGISVEVEQ